MKRSYDELELEVIVFGSEDVITTSTGLGEGFGEGFTSGDGENEG